MTNISMRIVHKKVLSIYRRWLEKSNITEVDSLFITFIVSKQGGQFDYWPVMFATQKMSLSSNITPQVKRFKRLSYISASNISYAVIK